MILYLFAVLGARPDVWERAKCCRLCSPHVGRAASSSPYIVAIVLRKPIGPRNAVLDGRFDTAEPSATIAVRTP
jgi:hypothetical protein